MATRVRQARAGGGRREGWERGKGRVEQGARCAPYRMRRAGGRERRGEDGDRGADGREGGTAWADGTASLNRTSPP